jgi:sulfite exporter TauE/SafE
LHRQHEYASSVPHFDVQNNLRDEDRKRTNWAAVVGHLLAYAGVGVLTVGTTLVVWSYFGGPPAYAPTGWLTCVAGQMLLFLGVVTLVSGGIEQTGEEVKLRIERLGERMVRIEQIAREQSLRGPSIPAAHYAAGGAPAPAEMAHQFVDAP